MEKQRNHLLFFGIIIFALLTSLLKDPLPQSIVIFEEDGKNTEMSFDEIQGSILTLNRNSVTLILPERGRSAWPTNIVRIESKK